MACTIKYNDAQWRLMFEELLESDKSTVLRNSKSKIAEEAMRSFYEDSWNGYLRGFLEGKLKEGIAKKKLEEGGTTCV